MYLRIIKDIPLRIKVKYQSVHAIVTDLTSRELMVLLLFAVAFYADARVEMKTMFTAMAHLLPSHSMRMCELKWIPA